MLNMDAFGLFFLYVVLLIPTIIFLIAVWRGMKAHESIAKSLCQIADGGSAETDAQQTANPRKENEITISVNTEEFNEIVSVRPEMALCLKEAEEFNATEPARAEELKLWYQKKSDNWLMDKLTKPAGFRATYGLIAIEAYHRKLDLSAIIPAKLPDELPKR